ncbi:MAG: hypothetical protein ACOH2N_09245 [Devosia sp.]
MSKHLFGVTSHVLPDAADFLEWKVGLCAGLGVEPSSAFLVGSGAVGISLNPFKNFKEFDAGSDLDVAIVSSEHFEVAWKFLRANFRRQRRTLRGRAKVALESHVNGLVFWGAVEADALLSIYPFGLGWITALVDASTEVVGNRTVKARIYKDFDALNDYQIQGVGKLRNNILLPEVTHA